MPALKPHRSSSVLNLFFLILLIGTIGLIAVYNASVVEAFQSFGDKYHFAKQQALWLFAGLILFLVISRIPITYIRKMTLVIFIITLFFMLIVLIPGIGLKLQGARRWINFGVFVLQPSELFKISLILYLAFWLEKPRPLKKFMVLLCGALILVMLQPDLGTAIIIGTSAFLVYYISGAPVKELLSVFVITLVLGTITVITSPYRLERIHTFLDPTLDPLGSSYHINQVLLGLGSGGWLGVGLGRSIQKHSYLPEATTDSIFAVIGEEMGFIGGLVIIVLLLWLVIYGFRLAGKIKGHYAKLVASGISGLIAAQTFVNLSAMVALVPLTGVPLPLISYGGSSLITVLIALGVLASASKEK